MSKIHQLIADANAYIDGEEIPGRSLSAIALLLQADLELKLEAREERWRGLATEVSRRLAVELPILNAPGVAQVIPNADGAGFVISGWPDAMGLNRDAVIRVWEATKPYRVAGWRFSFVFTQPLACGRHVPINHEVPLCQYCGKDVP